MGDPIPNRTGYIKVDGTVRTSCHSSGFYLTTFDINTQSILLRDQKRYNIYWNYRQGNLMQVSNNVCTILYQEPVSGVSLSGNPGELFLCSDIS